MSSTHSVAARDERLDRVGELEVAQVLGQRAGVDADAHRRARGAWPPRRPRPIFSGPPMLPGLMRTQCAPASIALMRQRVVEVDVGDDRDRRVAHDRLERLDVLLARHGDADDVGARPRRRGGSGPSSGRGSPSRSWSSSGRPRARRPRWGRRPRGSAARRPCPECTRRAGAHRDWPAAAAPVRLRRAVPPCPTSTAPRAGACARAWPLRWPPAPAPAATSASSRSRASQPGMRVVDVGCGALGLRGLEPDLDITGVDLAPRPHYPGPFVQADATERLPFDDGAFDLAYSSSVVEHVDAGAARGVRRRDPARGPRLVRADARRGRSRSSPTPCCPSRTGCPPRCGAPTGAWAPRARGRTSRCCAAPRWSRCSASRSTPSGWAAWPRAGSPCAR